MGQGEHTAVIHKPVCTNHHMIHPHPTDKTRPGVVHDVVFCNNTVDVSPFIPCLLLIKCMLLICCLVGGTNNPVIVSNITFNSVYHTFGVSRNQTTPCILSITNNAIESNKGKVGSLRFQTSYFLIFRFFLESFLLWWCFFRLKLRCYEPLL